MTTLKADLLDQLHNLEADHAKIVQKATILQNHGISSHTDLPLDVDKLYDEACDLEARKVSLVQQLADINQRLEVLVQIQRR